ncbi:MAG: GNAT family N-acetyltransferase [Blastocatellia bacterium]
MSEITPNGESTKAPDILVRDEAQSDFARIREIHRLAFGGSEEAKLVDDLRRDGFAKLSLVAEVGGHVVGHILFSRLEAPMPALSLAPVGVDPSSQKRGVGSALIREGLKRAERSGWVSVFVLGDTAYYERFGFNVGAAKGYTSPYSGDHFMVLLFGAADVPRVGEITYPAPFGDVP